MNVSRLLHKHHDTLFDNNYKQKIEPSLFNTIFLLDAKMNFPLDILLKSVVHFYELNY